MGRDKIPSSVGIVLMKSSVVAGAQTSPELAILLSTSSSSVQHISCHVLLGSSLDRFNDNRSKKLVWSIF
jgi:hypothetical protein